MSHRNWVSVLLLWIKIKTDLSNGTRCGQAWKSTLSPTRTQCGWPSRRRDLAAAQVPVPAHLAVAVALAPVPAPLTNPLLRRKSVKSVKIWDSAKNSWETKHASKMVGKLVLFARENSLSTLGLRDGKKSSHSNTLILTVTLNPFMIRLPSATSSTSLNMR